MGLLDNGNIGKNTEMLRRLHGESRDELAALLDIDYSNLYRIERYAKGVSKCMLDRLSEHYMTSNEEYIAEEIPPIEVESFTPKMVFRRVDAYFPCLYSKRARRNRSFRKAFEIHQGIYSDLRNGECPDLFVIPDCLKLYETAFQDRRATLESAVNHTGLWYMHTLVTEVASHILEVKPATFRKKYADEKTGEVPTRILEEMDLVSEWLKSEHEKVSFERESRRLFMYLGIMMNSDTYFPVGEFYLVSGHIYNIIGKGMSRELNRTFGIKMMESLYLVGNPYATRLLVV